MKIGEQVIYNNKEYTILDQLAKDRYILSDGFDIVPDIDSKEILSLDSLARR